MNQRRRRSLRSRRPRTMLIAVTILLAVYQIFPAKGVTQSDLHPSLEDIVVLSEDFGHCEAIEVFQLGADLPLYEEAGPIEPWSSPGRLSADENFSMILAHPVNSFPVLLSLRRIGSGWESFLPSRAPAGAASFGGDSVILPGGREVLTSVARSADGGMSPGIARYRLRSGRRGSESAYLKTSGVVADITLLQKNGLAMFITEQHILMFVDPNSLVPRRPSIVLPPLFSSPPPRAPRNRSNQIWTTIDATERYVLVNRWDIGGLLLVDLNDNSVRELEIVPAPRVVGGIAINKAWINPGLLAVHMGDEVGIYQFQPSEDPPIVERARFPVEPPDPLGNDELNVSMTGPSPSLAWSGDGSNLIVATSQGAAEFEVLEVGSCGYEVRHRHFWEVCEFEPNFPNGILTANGSLATPESIVPCPTLERTATPSPTSSSGPTNSVSPTPTSTAGPAISATPSVTASPTLQLHALHLPLLVQDPHCDLEMKAAEVVLLIDASSSMQGVKLSAAKQAALVFISEIDFTKDRVAVVAFNDGASLKVGLSGDRSEVEGAILNIQSSPGTRIDRGLEAGRDAFADARPVDAADRAIILLTDGRQSVLPDAPAQIAAEIRAGGTQIFAIGLGADVDGPALLEIAGQASRRYLVPTPSELAQIYRLIAAEIPCPPEMFWGGR